MIDSIRRGAINRAADCTTTWRATSLAGCDPRRAPDLVVENCASSGLRFDLGIMAHAHTAWLSDEVDPIASVALGYGCTVQFAPEVCNHWMVGDADSRVVDSSKPPGWWDFVLRVPMNGQFGISGRIPEWSAVVRKRVADNVALYRRIRGAIAGADVYHLSPAPRRNDPTGWTALEYVQPTGTVESSWPIAWRGAPPTRRSGCASSTPGRNTTSPWTGNDCRRPRVQIWPLVASEYASHDLPRRGHRAHSATIAEPYTFAVRILSRMAAISSRFGP